MSAEKHARLAVFGVVVTVAVLQAALRLVASETLPRELVAAVLAVAVAGYVITLMAAQWLEERT